MNKDLGIELKACEYITPIRSEGCIGLKRLKGIYLSFVVMNFI